MGLAYRLALLSTFLLAASLPVKAAIISGTYEITATDFGLELPPLNVKFSATVTFDNSVAFSNVPFNLENYSSPYLPSITRLSYVKSSDRLVFELIYLPSDTYSFSIGSVSSTPVFLSAFVALPSVSFRSVGTTTEGSVTFTPAPVPEPISISLLATGFLGLAAATRRRRRVRMPA